MFTLSSNFSPFRGGVGYQAYLVDTSGRQYSGSWGGNFFCSSSGGCSSVGYFDFAFGISGSAPYVNLWFNQVNVGDSNAYTVNVRRNFNGYNIPDKGPSEQFVLYVSV